MKYNYTIGYLAGGGFSFNSYANYRWQLLLSPIQYLAHFVLSRFAVTDRVSLTFLLLCTFIMHLLWQTNLMNMHKHLLLFLMLHLYIYQTVSCYWEQAAFYECAQPVGIITV